MIPIIADMVCKNGCQVNTPDTTLRADCVCPQGQDSEGISTAQRQEGI
jgi:hypothetical protein